ncbi:MAG TPA: ABC transporter permease [Acidimicrobiales bacterium]|nr:ABC transporter permease [Acidimicrobiales bacterium]
MARVILNRLAATIPLLLLVTLGAFLLGELSPGDRAQALAGDDATPEAIELIRKDLRLDDAPPVRYVRWLGDVATGDLGIETRSRRPVADELQRRWPVTANLALASLVISLLIGIPLGVIQGAKPGSKLDKFLLGVVSIGLATPAYLIATLIIFYFAVRWRWLPALGYVSFSESPTEWFRHIIAPATTLAIIGAAEIARQLRTGLVGVAQEDYIRAARARGLGPVRVMGKHALRNAAMPALTIVGLRIGHMLAGAVIIEQIFQFPGLGSYALAAVQNRDFVVVQSIVLAVAVIIITVNLIVDLAYRFLNPKVRLS